MRILKVLSLTFGSLAIQITVKHARNHPLVLDAWTKPKKLKIKVKSNRDGYSIYRLRHQSRQAPLFRNRKLPCERSPAQTSRRSSHGRSMITVALYVYTCPSAGPYSAELAAGRTALSLCWLAPSASHCTAHRLLVRLILLSGADSNIANFCSWRAAKPRHGQARSHVLKKGPSQVMGPGWGLLLEQ